VGRLRLTDPGEHSVRWIGNLTLSDDYAGRPFDLRPWQAAVPRTLFGTLRPDGLRQYRRCFLMLPRKQAKTQLSAAIGCYGILGTGRQGEQVIVGASDREQAGHLFRKAVQMVQADPFLDKQCKVYTSIKRIETRSGNFLQVVSSDGRRQHGHNPSIVVIDELHTQPNRELYNALTSSFGTRSEPLTILISTAGNRRDSLCYEEYEYACKVRDFVVEDDEYLPVIFEAAREDDWGDEAVWHKAMPALGDFCNLEFIRSEYRKARESPAEESKFKQFYLNLWVASTMKWLNRPKWEACGEHRYHEAELAGLPCYGGLDLSNTSDITAFILVFPMEDGTARLLCRFWIPKNYAEERDRKGFTHYVKWAEQGFITLTDGDVIDHDLIHAEVVALCEAHEVKQIRADPWSCTQAAAKLMAEGIAVEFMRQGTQSMNEPVQYLEILVSRGRLHHGNNPVLNWMADNVVTEKDSHGNVKFSKGLSADKIDGLVAMTMGTAAAMVSLPAPDPTFTIRETA
jgi:phage terminase large subunit-like protein